MKSAKDKLETKDRILDAAESLFASRGFEGASLRRITAAAGVNLSVVYYYFSTKEELLRASIERYLLPVLEKEKQLLKEALAETRGAPVALRKLLEIFVLPHLTGMPEKAMCLISIIFGRHGDMEKQAIKTLSGTIAETTEVFHREFSRTLPKLNVHELRLRLLTLRLSLYGLQKIAPYLHDQFPQSIPKETWLEMLLHQFEASLSANPSFTLHN